MSQTRTDGRAGSRLALLLVSVPLYGAGACLLGYGIGPGKSVVLVVLGALLLAFGLPLRFLAQPWRRDRRRSPAAPRATPADPLLHRRLRWTQTPGRGGLYFAEVGGIRWELEVDQSNQGVRYIIKADGRYVREVDDLPASWVLGLG